MGTGRDIVDLLSREALQHTPELVLGFDHNGDVVLQLVCRCSSEVVDEAVGARDAIFAVWKCCECVVSVWKVVGVLEAGVVVKRQVGKVLMSLRKWWK